MLRVRILNRILIQQSKDIYIQRRKENTRPTFYTIWLASWNEKMRRTLRRYISGIFFSLKCFFLYSFLSGQGRKREIKATSRRGKLISRRHERLLRNFHEYSSRLLKGRNVDPRQNAFDGISADPMKLPGDVLTAVEWLHSTELRWQIEHSLASATTFGLIFREKTKRYFQLCKFFTKLAKLEIRNSA